MFGELALSERAIADQGILAFGSATADANFIVDGASMFVANGSADMEAIGIKATIGVGVLAGIFEASALFPAKLRAYPLWNSYRGDGF